MKKNVNLRVMYFIFSFLSTLVLTRLFLLVSPSTNLYIGNYNIHHFYVGSAILIFSFLALMFNIASSIVFILSGIASALIVDELTYLIATDGSDAAYLGTVSLSGALISSTIILIIIGGLFYYVKNKK